MIKPFAAVALLAISLSTSGCAAWRAIMPGGVTPEDAEWSGIKSGQPIPLAATVGAAAGAKVNPDQLAIVSALFTLLDRQGQGGDVLAGLLGSVMPVTQIGETAPRWVLCSGEFSAKCREIPLNAKVHFAGRPVSAALWKPSRLTADDFND